MEGEKISMEKESYSILDFKEDNPRLENYRKDMLEKYLEFGIVKLQEFKDQGKTLDDVIEETKIVFWYVKNQRMEHIQEELGG